MKKTVHSSDPRPCTIIKSTTGHYSTIKNCAFAMSMCITSIIYLLLYGYTMITYLLIMMINTTTTTMYTKNMHIISMSNHPCAMASCPLKYIYLAFCKKKSCIMCSSTHGFTNSPSLLNSAFGIGHF